MSRPSQYICRRCGREYSFQEYLDSKFCRSCGTFLIPKSLLDSKTSIKSRMEIEDSELRRFFPYPEFRPHQKKAILFAYSTLTSGKIGLLSSPCGTGKSVSVLTAYFMAKERNDLAGRLLTLTRTRSQLEIYCRELKRIKEYSGIGFTVSIFKSKREMCPLIQEDRSLRDIGYRDFLHYCRSLKEGKAGESCDYYQETFHRRKPSLQAYRVLRRIRELGPLMPEEVVQISRESSLCPYEITKLLAKYADIIIGNYNYILSEPIRNAVLRKAGVRLSELNCVFDEAHSLPRYASDLLSDELSATSVRRALTEAENYGDWLPDFLYVLLDVIEELGEKAYSTLGLEEELVIDGAQLIGDLMERLNLTPETLTRLVYDLEAEGEKVRYRKLEEGKSPVSYLSRCASFVDRWLSSEESGYVHYVKNTLNREGKVNPKLGIKCLDPALVTSVINDLRSVILMSGTLWHKDYYIDVLGIDRDRCETLDLPNPFPAENRLILVDKSVTTKFELRDESQWMKIAGNLERIVDVVPGRIAVYFPSYEVMENVLRHLNLKKPILVEGRKTSVLEALSFLELNEEAVLLAVARGKISEGVDLSREGRGMLSAVVIAGLPYPKNTDVQRARLRYFESRFGDRAVEYANVVPCLNALAQSAGRLIRSPEDRGVIIIMDSRATGKFKRNLPEDWRKGLKAHLKIDKLLQSVESFLRS